LCATLNRYFCASRPQRLSPPPLLHITTLTTAVGLEERCKLPQCGMGRSPSRQTIWCILESKSAAMVAAVFADFLRTKCNFLHKKTSLISYGGSNSSHGGGVFLLRQSAGLPYGSRRLWLHGPPAEMGQYIAQLGRAESLSL